MSKRFRSPLIALALAGLFWGLTVPLSKVALDWLDGGWLTVARFGMAAPILALVARRDLRAAFTPAVLGAGAAGYGVVIVLQNAGIAHTSVSHAALIVGAVPALVALLAAARGTGSTPARAWLGFALAIGGVGLVAGGGGGAASLRGDALVGLSVALSAVFVVAQPAVLKGRDPIAVTAVQMLAGMLAAVPNAALEGLPQAPTTGGPVLALAALATAGTLAPFALFAYGQSRVAPELAGAFLNLEPLVGTMAGALAFGDPFGAPQLIGGTVILLGIALSTGSAPRTERVADRTTERLPASPARPAQGGRVPRMNPGLHQIQLATASHAERLRRRRRTPR
ncbi:DMT family transporter [Candidatus Solirubrobacter pratensis]|uniref:DMT family transporter n=1 Tax=Candidatus Solirubrobacter pratensis TaxID=1298857 RepID=UPI0004051EC8|nr:DMT family transporter [Candidatus Solirubrobacter pratensis]